MLILGEAPGRDEDIEGRPFVGRAGQLLDRMFAAIGLRRDSADAATGLYITNVMPWRPPSNREPTAEEMAMMGPFLARHAALIDPEVIVVMGNTPLQALLGQKGITRLRGKWTTLTLDDGSEVPVLPTFHPAFLLRTPASKRQSWADLLSVDKRLKELGVR